MAVLSRKTCSVLIDLLDTRLSRTKIDKVLYEAEVPSEILGGGSKMELLLNVFRRLENLQDYDRLLAVVQAGVRSLPTDDREVMETALLRDGFASTTDGVVPDENLATQHKTALESLVVKHSQLLDDATLLHHLQHAEELFRLEKWDASIGQSRNFVEQLLTDIAKYSAKAKTESPDLSKPFKIRDYLEKVGFF